MHWEGLGPEHELHEASHAAHKHTHTEHTYNKDTNDVYIIQINDC